MKNPIDVFDVCRHFACDYAQEVSPALWKRVDGLLRTRNLPKLAEFATTVLGQQSTLADVRFSLQVSAFFKKNASLSFDVDTKAEALKNFFNAEAICEASNERLGDYYDSLELTDFQQIIARAAAWIENVLGPFKDFTDVLPEHLRLTSGATLTLPRRKSQPHSKLRLPIEGTHAAIPYIKALGHKLGFEKLRVREVVCNRVVTVPKNWKTDRTIACEPLGNLPLQLAFDSYAKDRLRRLTNIDLSSQKQNQIKARIGSESGNFATLDLEQASDTICRSLVLLLLPYDWWLYLERIRSPMYCLKKNGKTSVYQKFSSMGNGATFALETLIFASLAAAVGSKDFSVYGDDIVVETEYADDLIAVLQHAGFTLSKHKSFVSGPYRESCGMHYYEGTLVTPLFFRTDGRNNSDYCLLLNYIAQLGFPGSRLWKYARERFRERSLPLIPFNGDPTMGIWIDTHTCYHMRVIRLSAHGYPYFKGYAAVAKQSYVESLSTYILWHFRKNYRRRRGRDHLTPFFPSLCRIMGKVLPQEFEEEATLGSLVASMFPKRRKVSVVYFPVNPQVIPVHIYSWTDYLLRNPAE